MPPQRPERGRDRARAGTHGRSARGLGNAPHKVRIIGGRFKRTPLSVPNLPGLRPTPDRVRETLFNWLAHLRPDLSTLRGLDLFAGTGALGFELASRGAAHVTLIEREPRLIAQLRALRDKLGATTVQIVQGDALQAVRSLPAASVDLVFIDPPYDTALQAPALAAVAPMLAHSALLYVEADKALPAELLAAHRLSVLRELRAGKVHAQLLQRRQDDTA
jgi:16S rRNA (guanine(966)-N(2))-methyltransferase RsmD